MNLNRQSQKRKGFTLIELIMTLVVVGIISLPLAILLVRHVQSTFQSNDYAMATGLGQFEMERIKKTPYVNIALGTTTLNNYQGYNYTVDRIVALVPGGNAQESLKQVTITVKRSGSLTILVSFTTYIAQNVLYGV